jgi:4-diphosphocytidyl-2-C-methyl-D-erythritol kinase
LEIVGNTGDYHALDSLVASVDIFDLIEIKSRRSLKNTVTMYGMNSEFIPLEQNHAKKAADAFCKKFQTTGVDITVYKNIPIGAGLGGSSADAAAVLNGMAKLYGITDRARLKKLADEVGSDTGYMLDGGFARMQGRGTEIEKLPDFESLYFFAIIPPTGVSAGACYRAYDSMQKPLRAESKTEQAILSLVENDAERLGRYLTNDLFAPACTLNQEVYTAQKEMQAFSPLGTVMTGSGSCVLGLFETEELCKYAQSRYKGKFKTLVLKTVKCKDGLKNPFVLDKE